MASEVVRQSKTASDAAVTLKNYAFALQSKDSISVIVIFLNMQNESVLEWSQRNSENSC